jgi:TonB family protein
MRKISALTFFVFISTVAIFAQPGGTAAPSSTAPVSWERYETSFKNVSAMFPKLPTMLRADDNCRQQRGVTYRAYADGAAYELTMLSSAKDWSRPSWCTVERNRFDRESLERRIEELEKTLGVKGVPAERITGLETFRFSNVNRTRLLVSDIDANKRWFELEVVYYPDKVPDLERFFGSLGFEDTAAKEIDDGAEVTLGDEGVPPVPPVSLPVAPSDNKYDTSGVGDGNGGPPGTLSPRRTGPSYTLVAREKARYTDEARRTGVQGKVVLRVTLLANGSVGSIVVTKPLSHGLTENAQYAARRLVFLPKRVEGKPVSVAVTVEYSFSIY